MAYLGAFGAFIDDLNSTANELKILREATKNATLVVQELHNIEMSTAQQTAAGSDSGVIYGECEDGCSREGKVCVDGDVMWCFLLAALVFGVCIGLWIAGQDHKTGEEGKEGAETKGKGEKT